jgi:hypothetical protein
MMGLVFSNWTEVQQAAVKYFGVPLTGRSVATSLRIILEASLAQANGSRRYKEACPRKE